MVMPTARGCVLMIALSCSGMVIAAPVSSTPAIPLVQGLALISAAFYLDRVMDGPKEQWPA